MSASPQKPLEQNQAKIQKLPRQKQPLRISCRSLSFFCRYFQPFIYHILFMQYTQKKCVHNFHTSSPRVLSPTLPALRAFSSAATNLIVIETDSKKTHSM